MATLYNKLGYAVDQILSADQALPNATAADSANVVKLNNTKGDNVHVVVTAGSTAVTLATNATLEITPVVGITDVPTVKLPSIFLKGGKQSVDSWASGDVIAQFPIPAAQIGNNRFLKLIYTTSANQSAEKVDAFIVLR